MKTKIISINRINVFSFPDRATLLSYIKGRNGILIAINAEKILHANKQTRELINRNIGYPDGIGAVWALKKKGFKSAVKIPGCELWLDISGHFYKTHKFYLVGGKEDIVQQTVLQLKKDFPGINIVGFRNGYIQSNDEREQLIADIALQKPDIVFVAMGSPKQELLMQDMQQKHQAIYQGLGGSFDVYVGNVDRAPQWWIKNNLEWAYRLIKQPARIKRQIHLVKFLWLLLLNKF
ncbi:UDP-N-acetyl-D-mannosaminouronate:lipid I N-acetyl-D-mannosaminouronosyltransferase [Prolixibacter denitrificans]|uniref:UDP-N-acetyl-D-mannosaminouronate:lipid I N-acetyl-D-mannosaminouronosyltransferase n=1 Tax=Prolixibacter denitrificans TaxID=1541063 RepID=A0A2P8C8Q3_9BACT|nr:UDP-N-acetyl-D-mannosaminouronate:lipid I N-acetyl-D-mannosaminouronosyltransferase [Prolixibacter denitrificans]